jgi:hypothetical protein
MTAADEWRQEGRTESLLLQLETKFGAVTEDVRERVTTADQADVQQWLKRVLTATTPEEVFGS